MGCCLACQDGSPAGEADVVCVGHQGLVVGLAQTAALGLQEVLGPWAWRAAGQEKSTAVDLCCCSHRRHDKPW